MFREIVTCNLLLLCSCSNLNQQRVGLVLGHVDDDAIADFDITQMRRLAAGFDFGKALRFEARAARIAAVARRFELRLAAGAQRLRAAPGPDRSRMRASTGRR